MKNENKRGRGGSYFRATPDSERVLVAGTDQVPPETKEKVKEPPEAVKRPKAQPTDKGAE